MEFYIDVEDAAGNRIGSGPITTATSWKSTPKLDAAGTFSFEVPATDPKAVHLVNRRIVRCKAILNGAVTELGAGIIDNVSLSLGNPSMLTVSGSDLLAELATTSVHDLMLCEQAWCSLSDPTHGIYTQVSVSREGVASDNHWEVAACHDGNLNTSGAAQLQSELDGYPEYAIWGYVGYDARFDRIEFVHLLNAGRWANPGNILVCQYYNGSGWVDLDVVDGTDNGGTWRSDG